MIKIEIGFGVEFAGDGSAIRQTERAIALHDIKQEAVRLFKGFTIFPTEGGWLDYDTGAVIEDGRSLVVYAIDYDKSSARRAAALCHFIKVALRQKSVSLCTSEVEWKIV